MKATKLIVLTLLAILLLSTFACGDSGEGGGPYGQTEQESAIRAELERISTALEENMEEQIYWNNEALAARSCISGNSVLAREGDRWAIQFTRQCQAKLDEANNNVFYLQQQYQQLLQQQMSLMLELQSLQ